MQSHGITFTTKGILDDNNVSLQKQNRSGSIVLYADGTYKIVNTNWVLCKVGIISVEQSRTDNLPVHSFRPLVMTLTSVAEQYKAPRRL